jgi:uncharacterized delta-60 repeat protein
MAGGTAVVVAALVLLLAASALAAAGALDTSFSQDGKRVASFDNGSSDDRANAVAIQSDGRIVAVGESVQFVSGYDFAAMRFKANGQLDASFSGDGKRAVSFFSNLSSGDKARAVAIQPDGKIVMAGFANKSGTDDDFAIVRLKPDGSLDDSFSGDGRRLLAFNEGAGSDGANAVAIQPDGRIVLAGFSTEGSSGAEFAIARLKSNGQLDDSFSGDGKRLQGFNNGPGDDFASAIAIQPDGRLVIVGRSDQGTGIDFGIARFKPNGQPDDSFSGDGKQLQSFTNGPDDNAADDVAMQENGRIVVAGYSDQGFPGSAHDFAIARFMPSGALDQGFSGDGKRLQSFDNGAGNDEGRGVAVQSNGRIVVGGYSNQAGAQGHVFAVARYTAGGALDQDFSGDGKRLINFGPASDQPFDLALQQDDRIVLAGFSDQGGTGDVFAIARLLGS